MPGCLRKTARILNVSHMTISRWLKSGKHQREYDGSSRKSRCKTAIVINTIKSCIQSDPLLSTREIREIICDTCGVHVSKELVRVALKKHGFTIKRARFFGAPPQLQEKTIEFIKTRDRLLEEGKVFWSLDETSFGRHGRPLYGYSQRGQQLVIKKGCPRFSTVSVIAIADSSGEIAFEKRSGSFDTHSFASFLRRLNIPSESVIILELDALSHVTSKGASTWSSFKSSSKLQRTCGRNVQNLDGLNKVSDSTAVKNEFLRTSSIKSPKVMTRMW